MIVIHHGQILFDGDLAKLVDQFTAYKTVSLKFAEPAADLSAYGEVVSQSTVGATLRVEKTEAAQVTSDLLKNLAITDLTVEDPSIEEVIDRVFQQEEVTPTERAKHDA